MRMRKGLPALAGRGIVMATIAALVVTISEPPAMAGPVASAPTGISASTGTSDVTDISSARRRRHYRNGGNAAGLAFMGMAIGTIGAFAAQQQRNDYYNNGYYNNGYYNNGYGSGYYGGGPYGGGPYYGRRYYRPY